MRMKSIMRWLIPFLTAAGSVLVSGALGGLFRYLGWFDGAALMAGLTWLAGFAEMGWFPWVTGILIGLSLGVWLDAVASRFDRRHPMTRAGKMARLGPQAGSLAAQIDRSMQFGTEFRADQHTLLIEAGMFLNTLEALGL